MRNTVTESDNRGIENDSFIARYQEIKRLFDPLKWRKNVDR